MRAYLCPKCRSLGLARDCADLLGHGGAAMNEPDQDYELEVTLTFPVPLHYEQDIDPHELATMTRERWISEPGRMITAIEDVVDTDDFDLQIKPIFTL